MIATLLRLVGDTMKVWPAKSAFFDGHHIALHRLYNPAFSQLTWINATWGGGNRLKEVRLDWREARFVIVVFNYGDLNG